MPDPPTGISADRPSVTISLQEVLRTGEFGPLRQGMSRAEVRRRLGPPERTNGLKAATSNTALIWLYGSFEFWFQWHDGVEVLVAGMVDNPDSSDHWGVPSGGGTMRLDPWVIREGLPLDECVQQLNTAGIAYNDEGVTILDRPTLRTAGGVRLAFHKGRGLQGLYLW